MRKILFAAAFILVGGVALADGYKYGAAGSGYRYVTAGAGYIYNLVSSGSGNQPLPLGIP